MNEDRLLNQITRGNDNEAIQAAIDVQNLYQDASHELERKLLGFFPQVLGWHIVPAQIKAVDEIIDKVRRKKYKALTQLTDVARGRIVVRGLDCLGRAELAIASVFGVAKVKKRDLHVVRTPATAYRAVHYIVLVGERPVEVQVMTPGQHVWASWDHPRGYKGPYRDNAHYRKYARQQSDRIFAVELGLSHKDVPRPRSLDERATFAL